MKYANVIAMTSAVLWLAGCATPAKVVVHEPIGPCHRVAAGGANVGSLQVYSARERAPIDINQEEFLWNNDFGKNEFLYAIAHSDYTLFASDGRVLERVRNSRAMSDDEPTLVALPAGSYAIQAEAEGFGGVTFTVVVPLVVEAGQETTVHLEPKWKSAKEMLDPSSVVRLADGRILGCRADHLVTQHISSTSDQRPLSDGPIVTGAASLDDDSPR